MSNHIEIWKPIPNYEGYYDVSNQGRVRSVDRVAECLLGKKRFKGVYLKTHISTNKYFVVDLKKDGSRKTFTIHQLVAMAFLNHIPNKFAVVVDHIDNNKLNNNLSNLQLTTNRHNCSKDLKNKSSKYTGVSWDRDSKRWRARIDVNNKKLHLGYFHDELEAHTVYKNYLNNLI